MLSFGSVEKETRSLSRARSVETVPLVGERGKNNLCFLFGCFHQHKLAHRALVDKLHRAGDLREQSVILATANIDAGLIAGAALADDDRTTRNQLAAENFHAKPLCVRIAAISRTA